MSKIKVLTYSNTDITLENWPGYKIVVPEGSNSYRLIEFLESVMGYIPEIDVEKDSVIGQ
jgi:hypothetical protein